MKTHITKTTNKSTGGFSTIELLIAFSVGIIFLTAAMMVSFSDPTLARQISLDSGQVAALDVSLDNNALATSSNKLGNIVAKLTSNWKTVISGDSSNPASPYTNTPTITDIAPCLKEISNATTWSTLGSRGRTISFGTALGDMTTAINLGRGGCDPLPAGSWDSPVKYPNGVTISSVNANDIAVIQDNGKRIAILATVPQGNGNGPISLEDIYTYDVTDPANPSAVLGKINTGKGINAIATNGEYIFALQNDSTNQLQVIRIFDTSKNVSDPAYYTPKVIATSSLQNVGGANPEGRSIAYYNNRLYIGTWNNNVPATSPEFLIYNVTNPTSPSFLGSNNLGHSVNSIVVKDSYAYLATTDNVGELTVMNISTSTSPSVAGRYDLPSSTNDAEELAVLGNRAYLGLNRATGGASEFLVINITAPTIPVLIAGVNLGLKNNTKVTGVDVHDNYAFIGTNDSNKEFRVLDVTNPSSPSVMPCSPYNYSAAVSALQYFAGYVFLTNQVNASLRVIYDSNGTSCN